MIKTGFMLLVVLIAANYASADEGQSCKQGKDCEVVKVLTRCDVDKQKLRNKIAKLEKRIKELEDTVKWNEEKINEYSFVMNKDLSTAIEQRDEALAKAARVPQYIEININKALKNTVSLMGGTGPTSLKTTPYESRINRGGLFGLQYQRNLDSSLSLGVGVLSNQTGLGFIGLNF